MAPNLLNPFLIYIHWSAPTRVKVLEDRGNRGLLLLSKAEASGYVEEEGKTLVLTVDGLNFCLKHA